MIRKCLVAMILCLTAFFLWAIFINSPTPVTTDRSSDIQQAKPQPQIPDIVQRLNLRNAGIEYMSCTDMELRIWHNGLRIKLTGSLHYGKNNNFRMEINSVLGKEADIGSNSKIFWYWSRKDKQPGLYWATHEDYNKTRLKTPFNPVFLRCSLGIEPLDLKDFTIMESEKSYVLASVRHDSVGRQIVFYVFIGKARQAVEAVLITDMNKTPLATCEIQEWVGDLPGKILYNWHEENRIMQITLRNPEKKSNLGVATFTPPTYTPQINMAER